MTFYTFKISKCRIPVRVSDSGIVPPPFEASTTCDLSCLVKFCVHGTHETGSLILLGRLHISKLRLNDASGSGEARNAGSMMDREQRISLV